MCKARGIITRCSVRRREDVTGGLSQPSNDRVPFSFLVMLKSLSYINFPAWQIVQLISTSNQGSTVDSTAACSSASPPPTGFIWGKNFHPVGREWETGKIVQYLCLAESCSVAKTHSRECHMPQNRALTCARTPGLPQICFNSWRTRISWAVSQNTLDE